MAMFRLNFSDGTYALFDSIKCKLFTSDGNPLDFSAFSHVKCRSSHDHLSETDEVKKTKDIRGKLRFVFGYKCNYACQYCSQCENSQKDKTTFAQTLRTAQQLCDVVTGTPRHIELWGGEPLVYLKHLKAVVKIFREKWKNVHIGIVTNGSLITEDVADYLLQEGITVGLSHDGPGQINRTDDPLKRNGKAIIRLAKGLIDKYEKTKYAGFCISATVAKNNFDVVAIQRYFEKVFPFRVVVDYEPVRLIGRAGSLDTFKDVAFDEESLKAYSNSIYALLDEKSKTDGFNTLCSDAQDFISRLVNIVSETQIHSWCTMETAQTLVVKANGAILKCHNVDSPLQENGSIYDFENNLVKGLFNWKLRRSCKECPLLQLCNGGCPESKGNAFADNCQIFRAEFLPIFVWVINRTFKKRLVSIEGDMSFPIHELIETPKGKIESVSKIDTTRFPASN